MCGAPPAPPGSTGTTPPAPPAPPVLAPPSGTGESAGGITKDQFTCVFAPDSDILGRGNTQAILDKHWNHWKTASAGMSFTFQNPSEASIFLGNVKHEYGGYLDDMVEDCYRSSRSASSCTVPYDTCGQGGNNYFGRGPKQLSHCYNYNAMSSYMPAGTDLKANPGLVADPSRDISWRTTMAFWTKPDFLCQGTWDAELKATVVCPEAARAGNAAAVTKRINGAQECNKPSLDPRQVARVQKVQWVRTTCFGLPQLTTNLYC